MLLSQTELQYQFLQNMGERGGDKVLSEQNETISNYRVSILITKYEN